MLFRKSWINCFDIVVVFYGQRVDGRIDTKRLRYSDVVVSRHSRSWIQQVSLFVSVRLNVLLNAIFLELFVVLLHAVNVDFEACLLGLVRLCLCSELSLRALAR